ncbi:hypothetical protein [Bacillus thuringiensis]|uniref:hypothetical protein n=1 Tax=Bacillus thuringiensis TaxID=1428 RepID=UPI000BFDE99E|nr:hypothetical protein [Bacillus thuringiensis]PGO53041.1 hypothetical protein CN986_21095 [Bacillus thuringiensis]
MGENFKQELLDTLGTREMQFLIKIFSDSASDNVGKYFGDEMIFEWLTAYALIPEHDHGYAALYLLNYLNYDKKSACKFIREAINLELDENDNVINRTKPLSSTVYNTVGKFALKTLLGPALLLAKYEDYKYEASRDKKKERLAEIEYYKNKSIENLRKLGR